MKIIDSYIEIIEQQPGIDGIYKQVEIAGRTCYKSEDRITDTSSEEFVNRMISSKHTAMLEHGTIYLDVPLGSLGDDDEYMWKSSLIQIFKQNKYSIVKKYKDNVNVNGINVSIDHYAITTNLRVFEDQIDWDGMGKMRRDKKYSWELGLNKEYVLSFLCEPNDHHEKRYTIKIVTDRGVSHEVVRHRAMSFAQESTRFCNYSRDKFGNELTFIRPTWYSNVSDDVRLEFDNLCVNTEIVYMRLLSDGLTPQQARQFLPNAIKTEIVVTGFERDWTHFLELRYVGATGKPHPDIKYVAELIEKELNLLRS